MNSSQFDQIVKKRADVRVQAGIKKFKLIVGEALEVLLKGEALFNQGETWVNSALRNGKDILKILTSDNTQKGWPDSLWTEEREKVSGELISIMDEMQKALLAKEPDKNSSEYNHPETASDKSEAEKLGKFIQEVHGKDT